MFADIESDALMPQAAASAAMRSTATAADTAAPASGWVDDFFSDLEPPTAPAAAKAAETSASSAADLDGDIEPSVHVSGSARDVAAMGGVAAGEATVTEPREAELGGVDSEEATPSAAEATADGGGRKGLGAFASAFGKKASKFGSKARKAIVEEAQRVGEDAREFADGVREGAKMTAEDTQKLIDKGKVQAKDRGWFAGLGGGKKDRSKEAAATSGASVGEEDGEEAADAEGAGSVEVRDAVSTATAAVSELEDGKAPDGQDTAIAGLREDVTKAFKEVWRDVRGTMADLSGTPATASHAPAGEEVDFSSDVEVRGAGPPAEDPLRTIRQNLASTADVSRETAKDIWRDVSETNKSVVDDLRQGVKEFRHVLRDIIPGKDGEGADLAAAGGTHAGVGQAEAIPTASPASPAEEPFWMLPSTCANYVCIEVQIPEERNPAAAVQQQMRRLGGRLAKQTQKVSSGLVKQARDLGQNLQERRAAGGDTPGAAVGCATAAAVGAASADAAAAATPEAPPSIEACDDADDIFSIGDEEGLSDPDGEL